MAVKILLDDNGCMKVELEGEIDHHTAKDMRETIDYNIGIKTPKILKLDFEKVRFMDSSGIGLIMGRYKYMLSNSGKLEVVNVPDNILRMIKLSGLTALGIIKI